MDSNIEDFSGHQASSIDIILGWVYDNISYLNNIFYLFFKLEYLRS